MFIVNDDKIKTGKAQHLHQGRCIYVEKTPRYRYPVNFSSACFPNSSSSFAITNLPTLIFGVVLGQFHQYAAGLRRVNENQHLSQGPLPGHIVEKFNPQAFQPGNFRVNIFNLKSDMMQPFAFLRNKPGSGNVGVYGFHQFQRTLPHGQKGQFQGGSSHSCSVLSPKVFQRVLPYFLHPGQQCPHG
jgi:hypothetical protein